MPRRRRKTPLDEIVGALLEEQGIDARHEVVDLRLDTTDETRRLTGATTRPELVAAVLEKLEEPAEDAVLRLPDEELGDERYALVRSAQAPIHPEPSLRAAAVSQSVLGHRLDLLERRAPWWRVRDEDHYVGWVHQGYLLRCAQEHALSWERGVEGEAFVSLGGTLVDESDRPVARIPWGARMVREAGDRFRLPDGTVGMLGPSAEAVAADRLADRFPPRGESVVRTARRWLGTPYVWGAVVQTGADCSGFVQSVLWMHGVALPRDSDMQALVGQKIEPGDDFSELRAGDLLYFAEGGDRISHVAMSVGGAVIIHSSISNGGVAHDDMTGDTPIQRKLRKRFVVARRVLPD